MSKPDIKILKLTLKKKWFDLIAEGKKKTEYRVAKQWSESRLRIKSDDCSCCGSWRKYDEVHFINGYGADKPFMRVEFIKTTFAFARPPQNGELEVNDDTYAICLGEVMEVRNWRENKEVGKK